MIHSKLWDSYFLLLIQIWLDVLFGVCLLQLLSAGLIFMLRLCLVTNQLDSLMVKIIETSADDYGLKHRAETAVPRAYFGNSRIPSLGLPSLKTGQKCLQLRIERKKRVLNFF
ncbi:hypothetical protein DITRI_Ditri07aG0138100 [Diplodiscus trichospermus]